ncbi:DUF5702 domain-containing protein [Alkalihalobacillus sp. FSL R5-0424]
MKKWLKKAFHKFIINENGAVSIYAIMITLLLFIFNAVLIDYVRIMAAERKLDQAVKAAARSTMSSFDKSMMGSYGLFGFKGDEANIFEKVVREHLDTGAEDYFKFAEARYVDDSASVSFNSDMMVASKDTFEYQILEDMKYKAPLEIGESILEGFLQISGEMKKASQFVDVASEVQKEIDARDEDVEKARKELTSAEEKLKPLVENFGGSSGRISVYPEVKSLADVAHHMEEYLEDKKKAEENLDDEASDEDEDEKEEADKNIKRFQEQTEYVLKTLNKDLKAINTHLVNAKNALFDAQDHNDKALEWIEKPPENNSYDNANQAKDTLAEGSKVDTGDTGDKVNDGLDALKEMIIDDQFFDNVFIPLDDAIYNTSSTRGGDTLYNFLDKQVKEIDNGDIKNSLLSLNQVAAIWKKVGEFEDTKEYIEKSIEEGKKIPKTSEDPEVEKIENEAEHEFKQAMKGFEELLGLGADIKNYSDLLSKVEEYTEFAEHEAEQKELNMESKEEFADSSMDIVDMIFGAIGDILINQRDKAYINEYILMRFSHNKFSASGAQKFGSSEAEVEFILYGLGTPQANVAAALGEIFAIRFAVNLIEAFTRPQTYVGNVFLGAIKYAFQETISDFVAISRDRDFIFFTISQHGPGAFRTGYSDYLRLFLYAHPEGNKMQRTLARIDQKTGNDLKEMPTYLTGEAEIAVELWFLPGVVNLLGNTGLLNGHMEDGEFRIRKQAIYSY